MDAPQQPSVNNPEPAIPIRANQDSFFDGMTQWSLEDWMFASASFSIYIGLLMLMVSPSDERAVFECLAFSSFLSFLLTVSGIDWVRLLKISDIRVASERYGARCAWMIIGQIFDLVVFGTLLTCYILYLSAIAQVSAVLGMLSIVPGIFLVGLTGLQVRSSIMGSTRIDH
ncbi:MAG: hypothetical protein QGF00_13495 [Planctomycetota bacterium]|jgi:hypothetical protein|nr:hypothetical protein [Planctomycetota bacterium]MDP7250613.1 hypothetical protein [Planctomycetota bacterium]